MINFFFYFDRVFTNQVIFNSALLYIGDFFTSIRTRSRKTIEF